MKTFAISLALASCLVPLQGRAADTARYDYQSAVGVCQGANAVYGSSLHFRPLFVENEGSADQYVSCALQGDDSTGRGAQSVFVRVYNASTVTKTVNCTLINGYRNGGTASATYTAKAATMAAGAGAFILWAPADITPAPTEINLPQFQCLLPAGTSLLYTGKNYNEEIGT